jgi:hypothetical protein
MRTTRISVCPEWLYLFRFLTYSEFLNLMSFGAAGDGIKDDTAAINAFLQRVSLSLDM